MVEQQIRQQPRALHSENIVTQVPANGSELSRPILPAGEPVASTEMQSAAPIPDGAFDLLAMYERVEYMERTAGATTIVFIDKHVAGVEGSSL